VVAVMAVGAEVPVAAAGGPARHAAHDLARPRAGDSRRRDERDLVVAVGIARGVEQRVQLEAESASGAPAAIRQPRALRMRP
jgi:hypothetical protein